MRINTKHIGILLLIPFFLLMEFTLTSYKHYHVLPSGEIICHSHPYQNGDDENSHTHSQDEFYTISAFSSLLYSNSFKALASEIMLPQTGTIKKHITLNISEGEIGYSPSRAPPSL